MAMKNSFVFVGETVNGLVTEGERGEKDKRIQKAEETGSELAMTAPT